MSAKTEDAVAASASRVRSEQTMNTLIVTLSVRMHAMLCSRLKQRPATGSL
jgi:hypothetical protein